PKIVGHFVKFVEAMPAPSRRINRTAYHVKACQGCQPSLLYSGYCPQIHFVPLPECEGRYQPDPRRARNDWSQPSKFIQVDRRTVRSEDTRIDSIVDRMNDH